ncbi:MAG: DHA2 family efflux MFS transporter permease subunit [Capsulimonadaceae bacterium]|nr:DHA2 family efflux MFS transporter permease subunit [Capsulimonadaceae bacterium]
MANLSPANDMDARRAARLRWWIVAAAMTGAMLEVLDTTITSVAVPQMMGNLGATLSEIGWVTTGYIVSNVIVLPMTGWLSDRFGRKRYFAASIILFTLASILCAASTSLSALIFWRVVQGLGGGGLLATGQVILLQAFPERQRGMATAIFGMGVMMGPLLGPTLGGYLTDNYSWPAIFWVNVPFGLVSAILTVMYVPDADYDHNAADAPIDIPGIVLLIAGMGSLQTVLERGQEEDWWSSRMICWLAAVTVVSLVGFVIRELRTEHPILDVRLFRLPSLASGAAFGALLGFSLYGVAFLLPVFLQTVRGYTAYQAGIIQLAPALASTFSFMLAGPLTARYGAWRFLVLGTFLLGTGTLLLTCFTSVTALEEVLPGLYLRSFSLGFLFIPLTIASLSQLKPAQMGAGSGIINLTRQLGGSVGIAVLSTLYARRESFHNDALCARVDIANVARGPWLVHARTMMETHGLSATAAREAAIANLLGLIHRESAVLSFNDLFLVTALLSIGMLPLIAALRRAPMTGSVDIAAH